MKTKIFIKIAQAFCLLVFAGFAIASASSKDAVDFMDGAVDGYQRARYGLENDVKPADQDVEYSVHNALTSLGISAAFNENHLMCGHDDCDDEVRQTCSTCNGTGKVNNKTCTSCNGNGYIIVSK